MLLGERVAVLGRVGEGHLVVAAEGLVVGCREGEGSVGIGVHHVVIAVVGGLDTLLRLDGQSLHGSQLEVRAGVEPCVGACRGLHLLQVDGVVQADLLEVVGACAVVDVGVVGVVPVDLVGGHPGEHPVGRGGGVVPAVSGSGESGGVVLLVCQTEVHSELQPVGGLGVDVGAEGVPRHVREGQRTGLVEGSEGEVVVGLVGGSGH